MKIVNPYADGFFVTRKHKKHPNNEKMAVLMANGDIKRYMAEKLLGDRDYIRFAIFAALLGNSLIYHHPSSLYVPIPEGTKFCNTVSPSPCVYFLKSEKVGVLYFRGSKTAGDYFDVVTSYTKGMREDIVKSYYDRFSKYLWDFVKPILEEAIKNRREVIITGYSIGGPFAQLSALMAINMGMRPSLIVLAGLRGAGFFACKKLEQKCKICITLYNPNDPIADLHPNRSVLNATRDILMLSIGNNRVSDTLLKFQSNKTQICCNAYYLDVKISERSSLSERKKAHSVDYIAYAFLNSPLHKTPNGSQRGGGIKERQGDSPP